MKKTTVTTSNKNHEEQLHVKIMNEVSTDNSHVIFIGNSRCFHTMDWYRNAQALLAPKRVLFATDLIESEGHLKLVRESDCIVTLFNIDWILLTKQSRFGNLWRNAIKTAFVPIQVWRTRQISKSYSYHSKLIFHAHTMYYMWVCWLARVDYVGTPQGSEILVRPKKSKAYRYFASKALSAAKMLTVDSVSMQKGIFQLCRKEAIIVQNGIDITAIMASRTHSYERQGILSIRGFHPNYRIYQILDGRQRSSSNLPLTFIYPFWEETYKRKCFKDLRDGDLDLGRLPRQQMYEQLFKTLLVISIPESDSSPRSVYEAIFCGCCVAMTYNPWLEDLPVCMRARLHLVDLDDDNWFQKAVVQAQAMTQVPYKPSETAIELFDQKRSLRRLAHLCYGL